MFQLSFNQSPPCSLVFMSLNRNGSGKSWKRCGYYMFFFVSFCRKKYLASQCRLLSTQLGSQERRKKEETSSIPYGPAVPKMQERILVWHRLWWIPYHILASRLICLECRRCTYCTFPSKLRRKTAADQQNRNCLNWIVLFGSNPTSKFIRSESWNSLFCVSILSGNKSNKFYKYYQPNQCRAGWPRWRLDPKMHYIFIMTGAMWHMVRCTLGAPHLFWMKSCLLQFNDLLSDGVLLSLKPSEWKD